MVKNCKQCGKLFQQIARNICPACIQEEKRLVQSIQEFLRKNKNATLFDIVNSVGVDQEVVEDLIAEGILMMANSPNVTIPCSKCGNPAQGNMCTNCRNELASALSMASKRSTPMPARSPQKHVGFHTRSV